MNKIEQKLFESLTDEERELYLDNKLNQSFAGNVAKMTGNMMKRNVKKKIKKGTKNAAKKVFKHQIKSTFSHNGNK